MAEQSYVGFFLQLKGKDTVLIKMSPIISLNNVVVRCTVIVSPILDQP